ncbi:MAG: NADH-quinone oxidoreductase subunit N [Acidobacteriota bacterium]|nr:MAG: NADH-quinone oxidoreductase subunit N [Acidobacteriota bacterium]
MDYQLFEIWTAMPTLWPAVYGLLLLLFVPALREDRQWLWGFAVAGMVLTIVVPSYMLYHIGSYGDYRETAGMLGMEMVRADRLSLSLDILFGVAGLLALLLMPVYLDRARAYRPEVYPLTFLSVAGMTIMVGTDNLMMIFLGLEVLSISLYVMCGIARETPTGIEAALKYFLLGAFSTGFLVYGVALLYGATGSLDLEGIASAVALGAPGLAPYGDGMLLAGMALVIVAFAFKIGAVPFHFWTPDVYQGAPTPVTAFMAAGTKAAAFGVLLRLLHTGLSSSIDVSSRWILALSVLAAATMIIGNVMALVQDRVKRLLAFSSVAHAGYLLLGLLAPLDVGVANVVFYLTVYTFMTIGAFAVVSVFQDAGHDADHISHFSGLWSRHPVLAVTMAVFLLSLTGIPPMGGFTCKYVIFLSALRAGHPLLALIMGIAAVIGAYYYLRVLVAMFFKPPEQELSAEIVVPSPTRVVLAVSVVATVLLGILPSYVLEPLSRISASLAMLP